jgi:murein DD-endopeptidase MepM/ murein hydrolase activator NlpD
MRALAGRTLVLRSIALAAVFVVMWTAGLFALPPSTAWAQSEDCDDVKGNPEDEKKLEEAAGERQEIQTRLNELFDTRESLKAELETTTDEHKKLEKQLRVYDEQAGEAAAEVAARVRRSYMLSNSDPVLTMLAAHDASDAVEQSRVLGVLAKGSSAYLERASSAAKATDAAADATAKIAEHLRDIRSRFDDVEAETQRVLDEAKETEARLSAKVAMQRAANGSGCPLPVGQVAGGLACPVDQPRSYTDTWGAPRSGGRVHMGVDILAPIGTPLRAYESGTVTRMNVSSLGGISLYMTGDSSANQYYYTHLSGYVTGISAGDQVDAGEHIGFVGDTGNAAGIPHLHWEVRPGGGANVNPYPYAFQACG